VGRRFQALSLARAGFHREGLGFRTLPSSSFIDAKTEKRKIGRMVKITKDVTMDVTSKQLRKGSVSGRKRKLQSSTKSQSVIDRIAPINFGENDGIKLNLYGRSGTGKTTLWATFPKPILAVLASESKTSGELRSINTSEYRKTIKQVVLEDCDEIEEICAHVKEANYATLVLDHATGLQHKVLAEVLGIDKVPEQLTWGLATQSQYGQVGVRMKTYLRALLDVEINVVIVAQQREFLTEGDEGASEILAPYVASALSPSTCAWLNSSCDYIAQTYIREETLEKKIKMGKKTRIRKVRTGSVQFCLRAAPHAVYTTKFRRPKGGTYPDVIVDPDYDKIMQVVKG